MPSDSAAPTIVDQLAVEPSPKISSVPKAAWHVPTITLIDIKRTMLGQASFVDTDGASTPLG